MRTRVKICGITRRECMDSSIQYGADALGFNMFEKSPRYLDVQSAKQLLEHVPSFVTKVGLFVNEQADVVAEKIKSLPFDVLQFHGDENNEFCNQFGKPFIKVLRIKQVDDFLQAGLYPNAQGFLFDTFVEGTFGGTGKTMSQEILSQIPQDGILAGGLNPSNVGATVAQYRPYSVDVSSGVEDEPGKKSSKLLKEFFHAVETADRSKS